MHIVLLVGSLLGLTWGAVAIFEGFYLESIVSDPQSREQVLQALVQALIPLEIGFLLVLVTLSYLFYRRINKPLKELRGVAEHFAQGHLEKESSSSTIREMDALAKTMNSMGSRLDRMIQVLTEQRNKQEAIFRSMREGVLVLDMDQKVITINRSAAKLLRTSIEDAMNKNVEQVIHNEDLRNFLLDPSHRGEFVEDVEVRDDKQVKYLQVRGVNLEDEDGGSAGSLMVLNDVTRLKRLEQVKTDLVANVSHELKTPITSIKGFVETLLDGALEDARDTERFLEIIARHSDRMTAIIDDLLTLAKLEGHNVKDLMLLQEETISEIIRSAVDVCRSKAEDKNISIQIEGERNVAAMVDRSLIEQALINLVDNAIKYSNPNGEVKIHSRALADSIEVTVTDEGPGIADSHLPRLFERFYRVDKARSRDMGGTGLGLAIVKHIITAHDGNLSVKSTVGQGSSFSIHLPAHE